MSWILSSERSAAYRRTEGGAASCRQFTYVGSGLADAPHTFSDLGLRLAAWHPGIDDDIRLYGVG